MLARKSTRKMSFAYDPAGRISNASDPDSAYAYTYDSAGRMTTTDNNATPNLPHVVLLSFYNAASRRFGLTSTVNSTANFTITYDASDLRLSKTMTVSGQSPVVERYLYDGENLLSVMDGSGGFVGARYFNGPGEDQLLAEETIRSVSFATQPLLFKLFNAPGRTRTCNPRFRRPMLCPIELRVQWRFVL